jgi:hypothetical protein
MKWAVSRALLSAFFMMFSCLVYFSALKMGTVCFPEMFSGFHQGTHNYIRRFHITVLMYNENALCIIYIESVNDMRLSIAVVQKIRKRRNNAHDNSPFFTV